MSQLAEPLWTDPGLNSGISVCDLISTLKKKHTHTHTHKNKHRQEMVIEHSPKILTHKEKATITITITSLSVDKVTVQIHKCMTLKCKQQKHSRNMSCTFQMTTYCPNCLNAVSFDMHSVLSLVTVHDTVNTAAHSATAARAGFHFSDNTIRQHLCHLKRSVCPGKLLFVPLG